MGRATGKIKWQIKEQVLSRLPEKRIHFKVISIPCGWTKPGVFLLSNGISCSGHGQHCLPFSKGMKSIAWISQTHLFWMPVSRVERKD